MPITFDFKESALLCLMVKAFDTLTTWIYPNKSSKLFSKPNFTDQEQRITQTKRYECQCKKYHQRVRGRKNITVKSLLIGENKICKWIRIKNRPKGSRNRLGVVYD